MKARVSLAVLVSLLSVYGFVASPTAVADSPRPVVVLSLSSYENVTDDIECVSEVAAAPEMPAWLSSTLRLFAEGRDLSSLDESRPWGVVIQLGDELSAYAFVPVTDAEGLSWDLKEFISTMEDIGNDVHKVVSSDGEKHLFVKVTDAWVFVSDSPETLSAVTPDPQKLLRGLDKQYDVAIRFETKNVPAKHGKKMLKMLDKRLGPVVRKCTSEETVETIGEALETMDEITLGWARHAGGQ